MSILDTVAKLAPIFTAMAASSAKNQDTNTVLGANNAQIRPGIVHQNLNNSVRASMFGPGFQPPQLHWGGPGSVARGEKAYYSGGSAPLSQETNDLQQFIEKDALDQAHQNYGIKDPGASSVGDKVLGGVGTGLSILEALGPLFKGGSSSAVGTGMAAPSALPAGAPGAPGTFGQNTPASVLSKLKALLGGGNSASGGGPGFPNVDQFYGWEGSGSRPFGALFPVLPENPNHD